ncbi:MAG: hypothetical protein NT045_08135, partial [Candidatus Aureabacteria bacterium]|nr:hypothetical protein [Candidatus Auribacterota bacterium]
ERRGPAMEEFQQDQETVIQQLRLLLAAKEEEFAALREQSQGGTRSTQSPTVTDQLLKELEDTRKEAVDLRSRMKEAGAKARSRIEKMAEQLEDKERLLSSQSQSPPAEPSSADEERQGDISRLEAMLAAERAEAEKRIATLENELREKEAALAQAAQNIPAETAPADPVTHHELEQINRRSARSRRRPLSLIPLPRRRISPRISASNSIASNASSRKKSSDSAPPRHGSIVLT